jgi:hypothetical protein
MDAPEIEARLADLGQELQAAGVGHPIRILVVGGAHMLTQLHNRCSTRDVDVVLKDIDDPSTSPLYPAIQAAVRAVAQQHSLPATWLNDVISDALRAQGVVKVSCRKAACGASSVHSKCLCLSLSTFWPSSYLLDARKICWTFRRSAHSLGSRRVRKRK